MLRPLLLVALIFATFSSSMAMAEEPLPKPTGEQVLAYSKIIEAFPATNRTDAADVLDKWMAGELVTARPTYSDQKGTGEYAACVAACCGFLGCNPVCVAACLPLR